MDRRFAPKAPRFGVQPTVTAADNTASPTASATTVYYIPVPYRKCYIERIFWNTGTLAAGSSTILATWKKYDSAATADVNLNTASAGSAATGDLKSGTAKVVANVTIATANGTDKDRILQPGDSLRVEVVAAGTVTTATTNLTFGAELLFLE